MNRVRTLLFCAAVFVACHSRPPDLVKPSVARSLFDGSSLAGWDGDPRFWKVEEGAIVGRTTTELALKAPTYLIWRGGLVGDFDLRCEFRLRSGNSGVQFRSRDLGGWNVAGYQADIEHPTWTGGLYEQDGRGVVATRGQHVVLGSVGGSQTTALGDSAEILSHVHENDWNEYEIRAVGDEIELSINGVRTCDVIDHDPARRAHSGILALQLHPGAPMKIEFRNLRLLDLGSSPMAPAASSSATTEARSAPIAKKVVPTPGALPQWIWSNDHPADNERAAFSRHFDLRAGFTRATLRGAGDNRMRVFVDRELAVDAKDWANPVEIDVTKLVRSGDNEITIAALNEGSAAALWIELVVEAGDKRALRLLSDGSWSATRLSSEGALEAWTPDEFDRAHASPSHVFGPFGIDPWGGLEPVVASTDSASVDEHALDAALLELPEGFRAELVYSVPKDTQGSWVCMCEDPRGRLYVCDQYGGLFRVSPAPIGSRADTTRVERIDVDIGSAQGLCWAFDALYAVVAQSDRKHGLYRLRDTDGDDRLDSVELLREFEGGGEHGPHAVVLGPDEKLWVVAGNFTKLPEPLASSRVPRTWGEDELMPHLVDPNGHDPLQMAPGGWVARTDRDGKSWELWAAGLRNAYDIAFDEDGELFTFDSDMEWDIGAPWYRPTRVLHLTSGADFGWRNGSAKWPAYWPDTLPSVCDVGLSSPTGLVFGTHAAFPARWRDTLFACDWAYGTIYAVHLHANGSSYGAVFEPFVRGKPFPVTDAVIGRDGAMYITTGGRRTQAGLYRVTWVGDREPERVTSNAHVLGRSERAERNTIDALHSAPIQSLDAASLAEIVRELGNEDVFIARGARAALELRDPHSWRGALERETDPKRLIQFVLAALHAAPKDLRDLILVKLASIPFEKLSLDARVDTLRLYQLAMMRLAPLDDATLAAFRTRLEPAFPSANQRVNHALAPLLVALRDPAVIDASLALIDRAATQEEKIHYFYCLRAMKNGWTLEQRKRFFALLDRDARSFTGGLSLAKFVDNMRTEAIANLSDEEQRALGSSITPKKPVASTATPAAAHFVRNWKAEQLAPKLRDTLRQRSFERGKSAFTKATCTQCHRIAVEGGATGPDLTGAGSRFSRADLLEAILEPSKTIPDQYQDTEVRTVDGDIYVGRIERSDARTIALRRFPPSEDVVEIAVAEIESRRPYPLSRMPSGLLDVLEEDEILDLFAYVLAGGNPHDASFAQ